MKALAIAGLSALLAAKQCNGWVNTIRRKSGTAASFRSVTTNRRDDERMSRVATSFTSDNAYCQWQHNKDNKNDKIDADCYRMSQYSAVASLAVPFALFMTLPLPASALSLQHIPPLQPQTEPLSSSHLQREELRASSLLEQGVRDWLSSDQSIRSQSRPTFSQPLSSSTTKSTTTLIALEEEQQTKQEQYSMLDEVWTLIDKYYIDRSYNQQDWKAVKERFQTKLSQSNNPSDKAEAAIVSEMVKTLGDKYSRILDAAAYSAIQKYDLIGVGVTLMPDPSTQLIVVGAPPIPNSASYIAGLKQGDWVTAINGVSTLNRNAFDIINQIAEQPNAPTIDMTIVPRNHMFDKNGMNNNDEAFTNNVFQRTVTMPRAFAQVKNPIVYKLSEKRADGTRVGYVRISEFNALIKTKLEDALHDLIDKQGANALVLDVRHNGGGAFQSAVEISSLFFADKVATYVVDQSEALIPFKTAVSDVQVPANIPMAIWLDAQSASASEVFAGSLHDNCRAVVMGERSFGKGLIQAVYGLKNGAGLVLTVARYVTPDGIDIQGTGLQPDIMGHVSAPIPGMLSDTSAVDFAEIRQRLDPSMCKVMASPLVKL